MKKSYIKPLLLSVSNLRAAIPVLAAPLAIFSASTAAAAAVGLAAGAATTKAAIKASPFDTKNTSLEAVVA